MQRSIEQILKFDSGLAIGRNVVTIERKDGSRYDAVVEIGKRGAVSILPKPRDDQMYSSWFRVKGMDVSATGAPIVWGARNPELLEMFNNPIKVISFHQ